MTTALWVDRPCWFSLGSLSLLNPEVSSSASRGEPGLRPFERWLVQRAFRFGPPAADEMPEPKAILEELADEVMGQMERMALIGFKDALRAMLDYHRFLFDACTTTDELGQVRSLSEISRFWGPTHQDWLDPYRRMIERAVAGMDREEDFLATLAHVPEALLPSDLRRTPMAPVTGLFALTRTTAARLEDWLARRPRHSPKTHPEGLSLAGADQIIYSSALRRVVGPWMNLVQRVDGYFKWDELPDDSEKQWRELIASWPFLWEHLHNSAWMLSLALWNNDQHGTAVYTELLLRWPGSLRHDLTTVGMAKEDLITPELFQSDWKTIQNLCDTTVLSVREIFAAAVANAWEDIVWSTAAIALRWRLAGRPAAPLAKCAIELLSEGRSQDTDAPPSWIHKSRFENLFYSVIRPVVAGGRYVEEGYAGELSKALWGIDNLSEPEPFPASSFTPRSIHRRDELRFCFEALLLASIEGGALDPSGAKIDDHLDVIEDGLGDPGFGHLLSLLNDVRTDVSGNGKDLIQRLLSEVSAGIDYEGASMALIGYLDAWIKPVNERREKRIRSLLISAEKLEDIRMAVDEALSDCGEGLRPFQPTVRRTREATARKTFDLHGVSKTNLVNGPLASSSSGLSEHIASTVGQYAERLAIQEAFRSARECQAFTPEAYREALLEEAEKLRMLDLTPTLLVQSRRYPAWLGEFIGESSSAPAAARSRTGSTLGEIETIQVLASHWPKAGTSLLVARERLKEIVYEEDDSGRIVTMRFQPDEGDPWKGTLQFEFGQEFVLSEIEPVVFVYVRDQAGASKPAKRDGA